MAKKKKNKERIKELQADLKDSAGKIWLAGLGALQTAEEEGSKLFRNLVEKGEAYESKGRETVEKVKDSVEKSLGDARGRATGAADKIEERLDDAVSGAFKRFGVPTRDEIATLTKRVEELTRVVEGLREPTKKPAAKSASTTQKSAPKTAAKKKTATKKTASKSTAKKPAGKS